MTPIDANQHPHRFASLPPGRRRLIAEFWRGQFGRIEGLSIVGGEPQWDPFPTIVRTIKLPTEASESKQTEADFVLKKQIVELFQQFDSWQNAVISRLEFRFGLPFLVEVVISEDALTTTASEGRTL